MARVGALNSCIIVHGLSSFERHLYSSMNIMETWLHVSTILFNVFTEAFLGRYLRGFDNDDNNGLIFMDYEIVEPIDSSLQNRASSLETWYPISACFHSTVFTKCLSELTSVIVYSLAYLLCSCSQAHFVDQQSRITVKGLSPNVWIIIALACRSARRSTLSPSNADPNSQFWTAGSTLRL